MPDEQYIMRTDQISVDSSDYCVICEDSYSTDDGQYNSEDDFCCDSCYHENYYHCDCCDTELREDEGHSAPGGEGYCEDCFFDHYAYCDDCGDVEQQDLLDNDGNCEHCSITPDDEIPEWEVFTSNMVFTANTFVNPCSDYYHIVNGTMTPVATGTVERLDSFALIPSKRYQGVEIEVNDRGNYDREAMREIVNESIQDVRIGSVRNSVNVVYDGSVTGGDDPYGYEYVLNPRRGDILVHDLKNVTDSVKLHGGYISSKCGYHLHVDTRDYDWYHFAVLTLMTKMIEPHIYSWVAPSRQRSRWCKPVSQSISQFSEIYDRDTFISFYYDLEMFSNDKYNDKRYHGLNLHSHFQASQGTELRYHSGTLNPDKMVHWSVFWGQVIDKCKLIADELYDLGDLRNGLRQSQFYQSLVNPYADTILSRESVDELYTSYCASDLNTSMSEYETASKSMVDILTNGDNDEYGGILRVEAILASLKRARQHGLPVLTFKSMCDLFDIPDNTRDFYRQRTIDLSNPDLETVRGFEKVTSFIEFDQHTNMFKHKDWLLHRVGEVLEDNISPSEYYDNYRRRSLNPRQIFRYLG